MRDSHKKNTVRYYLALTFLLLFLFFTNDFGLTDVQKTAIVVAAGIDRESDTFIVTSQVAIPQSSKQGKASEAVQIVSRGKTVGEAFEEINAKTGWYPKLVFCDLIILGESAVQSNVFEALDFFLRDEYLSDNCLLATCDGTAQDLLNTAALVDPSSSTAMKKVLSPHAERMGTVLPSTLREFAIGYFSDSKSAYLPILKTEPQQEKIGKDKDANTQQNGSSGGGDSSSGGNNGGGGGDSSQGGQQGNGQTQNKPVFSAGETALFVNGIRVETLKNEETFALSALLSKLRLAAYSVDDNGKTCTFTIKRNDPKMQLKSNDGNRFTLSVKLTMTAGIMDFSKAQNIEQISDSGDVPIEFFTLAEKKLSGTIQTVYEKCRAVNCDVFAVRERLVKYGKRRLQQRLGSAFENTHADVDVHFQNVR